MRWGCWEKLLTLTPSEPIAWAGAQLCTGLTGLLCRGCKGLCLTKPGENSEVQSLPQCMLKNELLVIREVDITVFLGEMGLS